MTVKIPISADASAAEAAFERIRTAIRRAGQEGKAFADIDLAHPELRSMADELRTMQRNFEDLRRIGRGGVGAAVRAGGYEDWMSWYSGHGRQFPDEIERRRHAAGAGRYILGGTRYAPPTEPEGDPGSGRPRGSAPPSGGGFNPMSMLGGPLKWILTMAGVGKLAEMGGQAVGQAQNEAQATDILLRHIRDSGRDFDGLRKSVRDAAAGLQLTYSEANRLALAWTRLTNESQTGIVMYRMRQAASFARGYGIDPGAAVQTLGRASYLGEDPQKFALLIGEAVSQGGMSGQVQDVMQALLHWTQSASRFAVTHSDVGRFASLYAGMNNTEIPGLRGQNAETLINQMNTTLMHGGGAGMASMALMYRAMARHGVSDPYQLQYLLAGGMFETAHGALGHGDNTTVYQAVRSEVNRLYAGRPAYQRYHAMARMFGINERQAAALDQVPDMNLNTLHPWMQAHHVRLSGMNFSAIADMADAIMPEANLQGWRKKLLDRTGPSALTEAERNKLRGAGPKHLRDMILGLLAEHGTDRTEGYQVGQSMADLSNALTKAGTGLVPVVTDLKEVTAKLGNQIGNLSMVLHDFYTTHAGRDAMDQIRQQGGIVVPSWWPLPAGPGGRLGANGLPGLPGDVAGAVRRQASLRGLDPSFMRAMFATEAGGHRRVSPKGAFGPAQLTPAVARQFGVATGVDQPGYSWQANVAAGEEYFYELLNQFHGNYAVAAAAYNAGPNNAGVKYFAATGDPSRLPPETRHYLEEIGSLRASYAAGGGTPLPHHSAQGAPGGAHTVHHAFAPMEIHLRLPGGREDTRLVPIVPLGPLPQPWGMPHGG